MAMTNAEKQKAFRIRQKQMGLKRVWTKTETGRGYDAGDMARDRLFNYLEEALRDPQGNRDPEETRWEFYTWLLDRAKKHKPDHSGYIGAALKRDIASARIKRETSKPGGKAP